MPVSEPSNRLSHTPMQSQIQAVAADVLPAIGHADLVWQPTPTPHARPTCSTLAGMIDHTLLKPDATPDQISQLCTEAVTHGFASVCVNPIFVAQAAQAVQGSAVRVCTVVGFPLGATPTAVKQFEAEQALAAGATELDMVIPLGLLKAGDYAAVCSDIAAITALCARHAALSKVIIETALLDDTEKIAACLIAARAGATFVKTSTGFAGAGATPADVSLMRCVVGATVGVKASGGIRTYTAACAMVAAARHALELVQVLLLYTRKGAEHEYFG